MRLAAAARQHSSALTLMPGCAVQRADRGAAGSAAVQGHGALRLLVGCAVTLAHRWSGDINCHCRALCTAAAAGGCAPAQLCTSGVRVFCHTHLPLKFAEEPELTPAMLLVQPARAALASGIEGSQNYLAWRYCLLLFFVGSLTSWSAVNNAAILAEVLLLAM